MVVAVVLFRKWKRRSPGHTGGYIFATFCQYCRKLQKAAVIAGPVYEDVGLKLQEEGADKYEKLQRSGAQQESEYDTIHQADPDRGKKDGHYEALEKAGMAEAVYHTLGMEGGGGGAAVGGYEALQRKTMKDDTYHSIGMERAEGGEEK